MTNLNEKKRRTARIIRDRKKLARYFHTHGYGRLAGGYARKKDSDSVRFKLVFAIIGVLILSIGVLFVLF